MSSVSDKVNLFHVPRKDATEISSKIVRTYPKNAIAGNSPIEFEIISDDWIDLSNTSWCLRCLFAKVDGVPMAIQIVNAPAKNAAGVATGPAVIATKGDYPAPVNNVLHAMIQYCKMSIGDVDMEEMFNLYSYAAYFDTLLNTSKEDQDTKLYSQGWLKDNPDNMDWTWPDGFYDRAPRGGAFNRMTTFREARTADGVWLTGRPACDMFRQDKYIRPNTPIRISFYQHINPAFWYLANTDTAYKMAIKEAFMEVRTVKISPGITLAVEKTIRKNPARYPMSRKIAVPFVASTGQHSIMIQDPTTGRFPQKLYVGFVDATGYEGNRQKNPWNFENVGITSLQFYFNGETFRAPYNSSEIWLNYATLFERGEVNITPREFLSGTTIYPFYPRTLVRSDTPYVGTGQLAITFKAPLTKNYKIIVYFECDDEVELQS